KIKCENIIGWVRGWRGDDVFGRLSPGDRDVLFSAIAYIVKPMYNVPPWTDKSLNWTRLRDGHKIELIISADARSILEKFLQKYFLTFKQDGYVEQYDEIMNRYFGKDGCATIIQYFEDQNNLGGQCREVGNFGERTSVSLGQYVADITGSGDGWSREVYEACRRVNPKKALIAETRVENALSLVPPPVPPPPLIDDATKKRWGLKTTQSSAEVVREEEERSNQDSAMLVQKIRLKPVTVTEKPNGPTWWQEEYVQEKRAEEERKKVVTDQISRLKHVDGNSEKISGWWKEDYIAEKAEEHRLFLERLKLESDERAMGVEARRKAEFDKEKKQKLRDHDTKISALLQNFGLEAKNLMEAEKDELDKLKSSWRYYFWGSSRESKIKEKYKNKRTELDERYKVLDDAARRRREIEAQELPILQRPEID
ncbi:MAG: hypothetical protein HQK53_00355, partial [Oligoflexia bacterium]|nr:hypothetical protein [Oligoflexia bacterium]